MPERNYGNGDFSEYRRLILDRLDRLDDEVNSISRTVSRIENDLTALKIRAGLWGAIAGALPGLIAAIVFYLTRGHTP